VQIKINIFQKHPDKTIVADILTAKYFTKVKDNNNELRRGRRTLPRVGQVSIEEAGVALDLLNIKYSSNAS